MITLKDLWKKGESNQPCSLKLQTLRERKYKRTIGKCIGVLSAFMTAVVGTFGFFCSNAETAEVTYENLLKAANNTSEWLMYGRTYDSHRYVPLNQITPANVHRLHPAWVFATGGENRGLEVTPLIHDGVLYVSVDQSRVFAIDARTGVKKWSYDPKLSKDVERVYCCGSNNRGVALLGNMVYVGTLDARLVALNKDTGAVVWETKVIDWEQGYSITGAPLVVKDMILTGVAGGEFGIRGFVKAYDAKTGNLRWTAYTIPGPGEPGNETCLATPGRMAEGQPGPPAPSTQSLTWFIGIQVMQGPGTAMSVRATTSGQQQRSPLTPIPVKSNGVSNIRPTTVGIMIVSAHRYWQM